MGGNILAETNVQDDTNKETDPLAYTKKKYLTPKEIAAYVLVNFGQKNLASYLETNMQFFMITFFGLLPQSFAKIKLFSSIYDALDDTISGLIIDRTRTRWGRVKPYLILPLPLWVVGSIMMFTAPNIPSSLKWIYASVAVVINGLGMSYYGAWELLIYNITPNTNERNSLITTTKFFELFSVWVPSMVPVFVSLIPKIIPSVSMQDVYTGFAVILVTIAAATAIFGFANIRERIPLQSREEMNKVSVLESIKQIFQNRPLFAIIFSEFFNSFKSVGSATEQFFWLNNTGALYNGTITGLFTGIPNYFMVPVAAKLIKKFGARTTAIAAGAFGFFAYLSLFLIGYHPFGQTFSDHKFLNLAYMIIGLTICGLPNKIITVCNPILTADMFDYLEWKSGLRNEALVTTIQGYFKKLSTAVNGWLSGMVLNWVNYIPLLDSVGNAVPQTDPKMLNGIFAVFCLMPALARGLYGLSFLFYNVHGKFKDDMMAELVEMRANRLAEQKAINGENSEN